MRLKVDNSQITSFIAGVHEALEIWHPFRLILIIGLSSKLMFSFFRENYDDDDLVFFLNIIHS